MYNIRNLMRLKHWLVLGSFAVKKELNRIFTYRNLYCLISLSVQFAPLKRRTTTVSRHESDFPSLGERAGFLLRRENPDGRSRGRKAEKEQRREKGDEKFSRAIFLGQKKMTRCYRARHPSSGASLSFFFTPDTAIKTLGFAGILSPGYAREPSKTTPWRRLTRGRRGRTKGRQTARSGDMAGLRCWI